MTTLNLFPQHLSTTQDIEVFNRCPYLWYTTRVARWCKPTYNNHLVFGAEFAKAREITLKAYHEECLTSEDAINRGLKYIAEHFATIFEPSAMNNDIKTPAKMEEVFTRYCQEEFPLDSDLTPFVLPNGNISVEQSFIIDLPYLHPQTGEPLRISAKPDLLGFDNNGICTLLDDKTASQTGMNDVVKTTNILRTQNQFIQYATLLNKHKLIGNNKITQVKVRKIVVTKTKLEDRKTGKIPTNSQVVEQYSFAVDNWYQNEWYLTTLHLVEEMLEMYSKYTEGFPPSRAFRRRYGNCERYFTPCQFTEHCTDGAQQDLSRLEYVQEYRDKDTGEVKLLKDKLIELNIT